MSAAMTEIEVGGAVGEKDRVSDLVLYPEPSRQILSPERHQLRQRPGPAMVKMQKRHTVYLYITLTPTYVPQGNTLMG